MSLTATDEYRELCHLERQKSSIYSHLFTLIITILGGFFAFYYQDQEKNAQFLIIVPILFLIWYSFIAFNFCYLLIIRKKLSMIESKYGGSSAGWYSNVFPKSISSGIAIPLYVICAIALIGMIWYCYDNGEEGFRKIIEIKMGIEDMKDGKVSAQANKKDEDESQKAATADRTLEELVKINKHLDTIVGKIEKPSQSKTLQPGEERMVTTASVWGYTGFWILWLLILIVISTANFFICLSKLKALTS